MTHTVGFEQFIAIMVDSALPPQLSMFPSASVVSAITGSATGGLQISMQTMATAYIEMRQQPEIIHRVATMASGGFDSQPYCGSIVATVTITRLTHKEAYKEIKVVIPVLSTLVVMGLVVLN